MRLWRETNEAWFTELYSAHYEEIFRYCVRRTGDAEASSEVAQEVFVIVWRRRADVPRHALPWLYGVARRLLANHWRAQRLRPNGLPLGDIDFGHDEDRQDRLAAIADLHASMALLPEIDREIIRLIGWEELTIAEAAVVLGCSRGTAAVRLYRARRRLTALLAEAETFTEPHAVTAGNREGF